MKLYHLVILILLSSCSKGGYVVESDYSYSGNFNKYRSFNFGQNGSFPGTDNEREIVERYVNSTLSAWGYNLSDSKPDLLVFYTVYYDELKFKGFSQPQFQGWLKSNYVDKAVVFKQDTLPDGGLEETYVDRPQSHEEDYNQIKYDLKEGTILISLFDRKKRKTVWQGYASGVFGPSQQKNDRIIRSAVIQIMDEFKLLAFGSS